MSSPSSASEAIALTIEISRGILRSRKHRRMVMACFLVAAAGLCLLGVTLLEGLLGSHWLLFMGYWAFCLLAVGCALLFAFYDMLMVRQEFSKRMSSLKEEYRDVLDVVEKEERGREDHN